MYIFCYHLKEHARRYVKSFFVNILNYQTITIMRIRFLDVGPLFPDEE